MPEELLKDQSNGHDEEYEKFIKEGIASGNIKTFDESAAQQATFINSEQRRTTTQYLINVPGAQELYKDDPKMRVLTEELKRTYFKDRRERLFFLKYVNDCQALHVPLDNAIRYLVSAVSEGRASINDAIQLSTHSVSTQRNYNYADNNKRKGKLDFH